MHLFGGKFCIKSDGSGQLCTCDDLIQIEEAREHAQMLATQKDTKMPSMDKNLEGKSIEEKMKKKEEEIKKKEKEKTPSPLPSPFLFNNSSFQLIKNFNHSSIINRTAWTIQNNEWMKQRNQITIPECICDRKNFDNFLWATVTVFQVRFSLFSQTLFQHFS